MASDEVKEAIKFHVEKRKNPEAEGGEEWALAVTVGNETGVIGIWEKEPSEEDVEYVKQTILDRLEAQARGNDLC